jgi:hypothetical protein
MIHYKVQNGIISMDKSKIKSLEFVHLQSCYAW